MTRSDQILSHYLKNASATVARIGEINKRLQALSNMEEQQMSSLNAREGYQNVSQTPSHVREPGDTRPGRSPGSHLRLVTREGEGR